jgi:hypothetical protein
VNLSCWTYLWKSLQRVTRDEPCCLDVVLLEQLQQTSSSKCACKKTPRDITCRVLTTVLDIVSPSLSTLEMLCTHAAEPAGNRINVDAISYENAFLAHDVREW